MLGRVRKIYPLGVALLASAGLAASAAGPFSLREERADARARGSGSASIQAAPETGSGWFDLAAAEAEYDAQQRAEAEARAAAERAEAERVAAEQAAAAAELERGRGIHVDWARWERLHICEQRDSWYAYGTFGNGLRGGGGLGMSDGAWAIAIRAGQARGVSIPGFVLDATPDEQMIAAQLLYDAVGWAWGCHV